MRQVMIVANQTLAGEDLLAAVRERLEAGPVEFWVVVPATGADHVGVTVAPAGAAVGPVAASGAPHKDPYEVAERRLERALDRLRHLGATVDGEVGDEDPVRAVTDAASRRQVDELIVSTLPTRFSHWLHLDLPSRLHRELDVPVTTVTAHGVDGV